MCLIAITTIRLGSNYIVTDPMEKKTIFLANRKSQSVKPAISTDIVYKDRERFDP